MIFSSERQSEEGPKPKFWDFSTVGNGFHPKPHISLPSSSSTLLSRQRCRSCHAETTPSFLNFFHATTSRVEGNQAGLGQEMRLISNTVIQ